MSASKVDVLVITERIRGALEEAIERKKQLEIELKEVNREVTRLKYFLNGTEAAVSEESSMPRRKPSSAGYHYTDVLEYLELNPGKDTNEIAAHFNAEPKKIAATLTHQKKNGVVQGKPRKGKYATGGNPMIWKLKGA